MNLISQNILKTIIILFYNFKFSTTVDVNDYPYLVHIAHLKKGLRCTGTIIAPTWVLTSANCILDFDPVSPNSVDHKDFTVIPTGTLKQKYYEQFLCPVEIVVHDNFDPLLKINDIAIIKLGHGVDPEFTKIVDLASEEDYANSLNQKGIVLSWPIDSKDDHKQITKKYLKDKLIRNLNKHTVTVIDFVSCADKMKNVLQDQDVCGLFNKDKIEVCKKHIGGPLMINNTQIGVTSSWFQCSSSAIVSVHARVDKHVNWIKTQMTPMEWSFRSLNNAAGIQMISVQILVINILTLFC